MIEVKSISMNYGQTKALDNVSFQAQEGEILGLLGPNAAGKTTLMRILTTFLYPSEGTALVGSYDIINDALRVRNITGYMPEDVPLYADMLVDEYLTFIGKARGLFGQNLTDRLVWVKQACEIKSIWKHPISEISRGYRQRVGLAQALIHNPSVLIFDEPTTSLDPLQIISIRRLIRELAKEKTIIFSTHILQEVETLADRIVILNMGRVIANGTRKELIQMATKGERISITIKGRIEEIESILRAAGIADELRFQADVGDGYVKFWLRAATRGSLTPALNLIIKQRNWQVAELKHEEPALEETFIQLLSRDKTGK